MQRSDCQLEEYEAWFEGECKKLTLESGFSSVGPFVNATAGPDSAPWDTEFAIMAAIREWSKNCQRDQVKKVLGDNLEKHTEEHITEVYLPKMLDQLIVIIVDECDGKVKSTLQKSFRSLRPPRQTSIMDCFHDDMYFGDSKLSVGIQIADLCSYFIARHLEDSSETEPFYKMIEDFL